MKNELFEDFISEPLEKNVDESQSQSDVINLEKQSSKENSNQEENIEDNKTQTNNDNSTTDDEFIEANSHFLSDIEKLRSLEIKYHQTIAINDDERKNPNVILSFLKKIKKNFNLEFEHTNSADLFKQTPKGKLPFDNILEQKYNELTMLKATERFYVYIVLLNRKAMKFDTDYFSNLSQNYNFDIKDIYEIKDIDAHCFSDLKDIPSEIVKRCQQSAEYYRKTADKHQRNLKKIIKRENAVQNQIQSVSNSENLSPDEMKNKTEKLQSDLRKVHDDAETLSYDVYDDLLKTQNVQDPQSDDIASFVSDFSKYAIEVDNSVLEKKNRVSMRNDGTFYTQNRELIKTKQLDDIFFQDTIRKVWVRARESITNNIWRISGIRNLNNSNKENILQQIAKKIINYNEVNIISFKPNTIFTQNGVIELNMEETHLKSYHFIPNTDLDTQTMMLKYPTYYRINIEFDPNVQMNFNNYSLGHKVTVSPAFIFDSLGRRGYEIYDYMQQDEIDEMNKEAYERSNLIKQFVLNMLVLYNDLPIIGKKFLYLYNASNSGKTTFMKLLLNMMGKQNDLGATTLDITALDSKKSPFGLVNVKDKFLLAIDEATDGDDVIDTTNLKQLTTKTLEINANKKNSDYVSFYPQASVLLASNYAPHFKDESGGTERRFLAFQLLTGYKQRQSDDKPEDFSFIQDELIYDDEFKSACLKHILDTVDMSINIPKSVVEDADTILSKENEIKELIDDKIRNIIDEPLIITEKDLYEIYKIEMASQNRKPTNIRNLTNFVKGLDKFKNGIYKVNRNHIHSLEMINKVAYVEGMLFSKILSKQDSTNSTFVNLVTKHFSELMRQRETMVKAYHQQVLDYRDPNKNQTFSRIGRVQKSYYVILPNNEVYKDYKGGNDVKVFRQIANNLRDEFNVTMMKDKNIEILNKLQNTEIDSESMHRLNNKLPFAIRLDVDDSFMHYQVKKQPTSDRNSFYEFLIK
ncbi:hypothetical protein B8W95_12350 [Staphylococcus pasteuri]|nr:hypothetical protein B8W95_12350 [Staphylococcus pasteuri]